MEWFFILPSMVLVVLIKDIRGYFCKDCPLNFYWDPVVTICTRCDIPCYDYYLETTISGHICATSDQCAYHYRQISKDKCAGNFVYNPAKETCENCKDCYTHVELVLNSKSGYICNDTCRVDLISTGIEMPNPRSQTLKMIVPFGVALSIFVLLVAIGLSIYFSYWRIGKVRKKRNKMIIEESSGMLFQHVELSTIVKPKNIDVHNHDNDQQHKNTVLCDHQQQNSHILINDYGCDENLCPNSPVACTYPVSSTSLNISIDENNEMSMNMVTPLRVEDLPVTAHQHSDILQSSVQETTQTVEQYTPLCSNPSKHRSHQALTATTTLLTTPSFAVTEQHPHNTGLSRESNFDSDLGLMSIISSTGIIDCHPVQPRHESGDSSYGTGDFNDNSISLDFKNRSRYTSESSESEYDFRSTHFQADDKNVGDEPHIKNKNEHGFETANEIEFLPKNLKHIQNIQQIMQDLAKEEWVRRLISNGKFVKVTVGQLDVVNAAILVEKITGLSRNQYECVL